MTIKLKQVKLASSHTGQVNGSRRKRLARSKREIELKEAAAQKDVSLTELRRMNQAEVDKVKGAPFVSVMRTIPRGRVSRHDDY